MTKRIEEVLAGVRELPEDERDWVADAVLCAGGVTGPQSLSLGEIAQLEACHAG